MRGVVVGGTKFGAGETSQGLANFGWSAFGTRVVVLGAPQWDTHPPPKFGIANFTYPLDTYPTAQSTCDVVLLVRAMHLYRYLELA